jgi:hypothetical protein
MHMRKSAGAALAVVGLTALVAASSASAQGPKKLEPLNQYVVSGKIDPEDLARAGQDLTEGGVRSHKGGWVITATAQEADSLEAKCATVRPLSGRERRAAVAAPSPLTDPTHGYNASAPGASSQLRARRPARSRTSRSSSGTPTSPPTTPTS